MKNKKIVVLVILLFMLIVFINISKSQVTQAPLEKKSVLTLEKTPDASSRWKVNTIDVISKVFLSADTEGTHTINFYNNERVIVSTASFTPENINELNNLGRLLGNSLDEEKTIAVLDLPYDASYAEIMDPESQINSYIDLRLFNQKIGDGVCGKENAAYSPNDCPSNETDGLCNPIQGDGCDHDCLNDYSLQQVDSDCVIPLITLQDFETSPYQQVCFEDDVIFRYELDKNKNVVAIFQELCDNGCNEFSPVCKPPTNEKTGEEITEIYISCTTHEQCKPITINNEGEIINLEGYCSCGGKCIIGKQEQRICCYIQNEDGQSNPDENNQESSNVQPEQIDAGNSGIRNIVGNVIHDFFGSKKEIEIEKIKLENNLMIYLETKSSEATNYIKISFLLENKILDSKFIKAFPKQKTKFALESYIPDSLIFEPCSSKTNCPGINSEHTTKVKLNKEIDVQFSPKIKSKASTKQIDTEKEEVEVTATESNEQTIPRIVESESQIQPSGVNEATQNENQIFQIGTEEICEEEIGILTKVMRSIRNTISSGSKTSIQNAPTQSNCGPQRDCPGGTTRCPSNGECKTSCEEGTDTGGYSGLPPLCPLISERYSQNNTDSPRGSSSSTGGICGNGLDDDLDEKCDAPDQERCVSSEGTILPPDEDCCPVDNPCDKPIIEEDGTCGTMRDLDCRLCETAFDCFDANDATTDICVGRICIWQ